MFKARRIPSGIAFFVLPALLVFSFQSTLEVFHSIKEENPSHPNFGGEEDIFHDPSEGDHGEHDPYFCHHSHVFAPLGQLTVAFNDANFHTTNASFSDPPVVGSTLLTSERGPPVLTVGIQ